MKRLCVIIMVVLFCSAALAAPPAPDDFAFGLIVEAPGAEAIYALPLPEELYRGIYRADLGDMRMFNANGETVPHMLRRSVQKDTLKIENAPPVALPFFPVYETGVTDGGATGIHVETNESGVVVDVTSADSAAADSRLSAYLIDASALEQRPSSLYIDWTDNSTSFAVSVDVEASVDLNRWHAMARNAALVKLDFGGQRLNRQVIELPAADAKYMRLSWPPQARGARVISVQALFPDELSVNRQVRQWAVIEGRAVHEKQSAYGYEYTSDAKFPVDAVNIKLPERNSLVQAVVKSRNDEHAVWRHRGQGIFYTLMVDGALIENNPVSLDCTAERYWRLETGSESGIGSGVPALQLGWIPHEVLFVARGEGPFTLAYGSAAVKMSEQPLDAMLAVLGKKPGKNPVTEAHIKQKIVLGGEKCLLPPGPPLPWKVWILWFVLVAGVVVLGVMAWKLFKQMNAPGNPEQ